MTPEQAIKNVQGFIANMPAMMELQVAMARLQRARFKALLKEGFTEAQAIELCKKV